LIADDRDSALGHRLGAAPLPHYDVIGADVLDETPAAILLVIARHWRRQYCSAASAGRGRTPSPDDRVHPPEWKREPTNINFTRDEGHPGWR